MSDTGSGSGRDPVEQLLESFLGRLRRGERPSLEEYAARCPERAEEIRELFPAMVEMEQLKPAVANGANPPDQPPPRPASPHPERLGDYRILRVIGEGGMGVVYEAEHESLSNQVALKVMHPRFRADGSHVRRFRREARSAARLHHTNIVPVFDFGEQDGICYYAMQYIAGVGLNDVLGDVRRLREDSAGAGQARTPGGDDDRRTVPLGGSASLVARGLVTGQFAIALATPTGSDARTVPLDPGQGSQTSPVSAADSRPAAPEALAPEVNPGSSSFACQPESIYFREIARLGAQVADALDHAHRQGVVHRDIKPSNLLLDAQGNVWVADFGLAKVVEEEEFSQSRDLVGTLRFMAPERFRGVTDRRGDIYAAGATLYEMLALRPAFDERDQIQLIDRITHQAPAALRQHDRRIPRDLETIVLKAMAKEPKDRFATAGELRDELRRFLEGRPIRSRPVPTYERFWRWCRRNRMLAAASIMAAILLAFVVVAAPITAWTYRLQLQELKIAQGHTLNAERKGRLDLGKSYQAEGAALQRTGLIGQRFRSLEQLGRAVPLLREHPDSGAILADLRDQAITAMGLFDLRLVRRREVGPLMSLALDPAFERYAATEFYSEKSHWGVAVVRSMADDRELFRIPRPAPALIWTSLGFSPDGQYLLAAYGLTGGGVLHDVWHLGKKERVFRRQCHGVLFHPDGRRLIYRPSEKELAVWDLAEGRETRRFALDLAPAALRLDPEGRRIAVNASSGPRKVEIIELESGRVLDSWTENAGNGVRISWSPDGRLLAVDDLDGRAYVRDTQQQALNSVLSEHMGRSGLCEFSPAGSLLVTGGWYGPTRIWHASSGDLLVSVPRGVLWISADGRRLAIHDGSRLDIWEIAPEQELITLNPGRIGNRTADESRGDIAGACFSPDGELVAVATLGGTFVYDGRDGRELGKLESGWCETVLFDRDGRSLITHGERGVFRWPIRDDPGGGQGARRIGPPVLLYERFSGSRYDACWLADGRTLAMNDEERSRILLVDTGHPHPARQRRRALSTPTRTRLISAAAAGDGRWVAAGTWNEEGACVWDLPRRRFVRVVPRGDTPADGHTFPSFSPDGHWLVVNSNVGAASGYYFWEVGTWKRGPFIPRPEGVGWSEPVFSPDGAMIALSHSANQIRLAETASGRTIAHLTTLQALAPRALAFSPDGTRLIAATDRQTALIWDLRRIRQRLREMGLDWDQPSFPPEDVSPGAARSPIHSIRVLGEAPEPAARRAAELAACEARLRGHPDDADALFDRGWLKLRMSKAAVAIPDLERGLRLRPDDADALYLLADAQIQANDGAAARATLEKYLAHAGDDADARALKGRLALQVGRLQEAEDDDSQVLDLDPERGRVRFERAQVRLRLGRLEDALADLDLLVLRYSQDPNLLGLRSHVHERLGHREQALADLKRAAESPAAGAESYNRMAWRLATGPATLRDSRQAVELARKAVTLSPETAIFLNTLGVAQYRAGQFAEAIATLEKSLAAAKGESDAFDLFFLAMARYRLGRLAEARADFDRAVEWRRHHPNLPQPTWTQELDGFQAEARDVLYGTPTDFPADVFAPPDGP